MREPRPKHHQLNTASTSFILLFPRMPTKSPEPLMTDCSLRLLLDFDACAQRDKGQASVFLHRRDRKFALTCKEQSVEATPKRWIAYINRFSGAEIGREKLTQTLRFWKCVNTSFLVIGALFGIFSMLSLLFFDGGHRINVTVIIAFVAFQLLLAVFTTAQSLVGWRPWHSVIKRFRKNSQSSVLTGLQPVLMARAAQLGGLCFALGGLITLLVMVLLQDLAFGWSTTLETGASSYHAMIAAIAAPWAWLWPAAAPEIGLVEATRFFRASLGQDNITPNLWGQWWPFIAMLWTTWALLPRLILYLLAGILIKRKARQLLLKHPAMSALMYRMETEILETGNDHNDASDFPNLNNQQSLTPLPKSSIILTWAGAGESELPTLLTEAKRIQAKVGGRSTLEDDEKTLEKVAEQLVREAKRCVLLATRCWEPPTGELEDFITRAKELWPEGAHIVLVPLASNISREPEQHHIQQWLRFAGRMQSQFVSVSVINSSDDSHFTRAGPKA